MVIKTRPRGKLQIFPNQLHTRQPLTIYPGSNDEERLEITPESLIGTGDFDPITVMVAGRRGRGKTLALTFVGSIFRQAYDIHRVNAKVAANYNTDVAHSVARPDGGSYATPFILDDIMQFPFWADKLLVLIDEASASFPRRRSTARINLDFSTFMQQIRKRDVEVVFTSQFPGMLDDQLLINIDLYCMANMWPREGRDKGKYVTIYIWDWHGQFTGRFVKPRIPPDGPPTWRRTFSNVNRIFNHYNTKEVIGRAWASDAQRDAVAAQYWETDEEPVEQTPVLVPVQAAETLEGFLRSVHQEAGPFNITRLVKESQEWDSSLRDAKDLTALIDSWDGWEVFKNGTQMAARFNG